MSRTSSRPHTVVALLVLAAALVLIVNQAAGPAGAAADPAAAGGWVVNKLPQGKPVCSGAGFAGSYFDSLDCGFGSVKISGAAPTSVVQIEFVAEDGTSMSSVAATYSATTAAWSYNFQTATTWKPGKVTMYAVVDGVRASGPGEIFYQQLGASIAPENRVGGYRPADPIRLQGHLYEMDDVGADTAKRDVTGTYSLRVVTPSRPGARAVRPLHRERAASSTALPPSATAGPDRNRRHRLRGDGRARGRRRLVHRPPHRGLARDDDAGPASSPSRRARRPVSCSRTPSSRPSAG